MAAALPEVTEGTSRGNRSWSVGGKALVWERLFSKTDITRFGDARPPEGLILAVRVDDLGEKDCCPVRPPRTFSPFPSSTATPLCSFNWREIPEKELREAILDGWLACAPAHFTESYLDG